MGPGGLHLAPRAEAPQSYLRIVLYIGVEMKSQLRS